MQLFKKTTAILSILFWVFTVCLAVPLFASDSKTGALINCDIQHQPCTRQISGTIVTLDIQPRPVKAMKDLIFEVQIKNADLTRPPMIDLSMPGMKMGRNQVTMKMTAKGVYQGTGIIVRCPSGKTVWQATVNLPGTGSTSFIFDVIY